MSSIAFNEELDRRIEYNRRLHNQPGSLILTEADFRHYIFMLGLLEYEFTFIPKMTGKSYKPYCHLQSDEVKTRNEEATA